jgi:hypothetical protein
MGFFAFSIPLILYSIYQWAVPVIIFTALLGFRWREGFWGNILSLGSVLFSILAAVGWWELLAYFVAVKFPKILFFADWMALWTIFLVSLILLESAHRFMSRVKVRFIPAVEYAGNTLAILLLGSALYGFYLFAEDISPLGDAAVAGETREKMIQDTIPVQIFRMLSAGNLSGFSEIRQFDVYGDFREQHLKRRQAIMSQMVGGENATVGFGGDADAVEKIKPETSKP